MAPLSSTVQSLSVSYSSGRFGSPMKVAVVLGTRPEAIKLAPVIRALHRMSTDLATLVISSGQHETLLHTVLGALEIKADYDLSVMTSAQNPNEVCSRVLAAIDPILETERPDLVVVQGDTTTALAGALSAFHRKIPVAHVEAGLRSNDPASPFPEEMNRRLITQLCGYHFAATEENRWNLLKEHVAEERIFVTGNPVVDSLIESLSGQEAQSPLREVLESTSGLKRLVLTTHRRESFGKALVDNLSVLRDFVYQYEDVALIFPVHPNPIVKRAAENLLSGHQRIHLIGPLPYDQFLFLLKSAWLLVSDSGGIQEEAPTVGKPLLILRDNTERPEVIESGFGRLVGGCPLRLSTLLNEEYAKSIGEMHQCQAENPFGDGRSGHRIATIIRDVLLSDGAAAGISAIK